MHKRGFIRKKPRNDLEPEPHPEPVDDLPASYIDVETVDQQNDDEPHSTQTEARDTPIKPEPDAEEWPGPPSTQDQP
jgi:hypothetical protein